MPINYQCLEDRCLVRPVKKTELETTDSGIVIPDTVKKDVREGIIISCGPGRYAGDTGMAIPTVLAKGDFVLYGANQGMPLEIETENGKEEVLIMRESDCLLVISKK